MQKNKHTIFALVLLAVVSLSFLTVFSIAQSNTDAFLQNEQPNISGESINPVSDFSLSDLTDNAYEYNATASFNRTIILEHYGIVTLHDNIKFTVVGNESITYFNYTLANINVDTLRFVAFRASNNSFGGLLEPQAVRTYTFSKMLNYTTFVVPFNKTLATLERDALYYISAYMEFSMPYNVSLENQEQLLYYKELLYPLINNVPIINSTTTVLKQGNDQFIDSVERPITPTNETEGLTFLLQSAEDTLRWSNISRKAFNYSQSYSDDLLMNIYTSSVSTYEALEEATNAILFKATRIYRKLTVDPYGLIKITEEQHLVFLGPERLPDHFMTVFKLYALNAFTIVLPPNSTVTSLEDDVGSLNLEYQKDESGQAFEAGSYNLRESIFPFHPGLAIFPRYPLFKGDELTFTIEYQTPLSTFLSKEQGSVRYELNLEPCSVVNWTVDELILDVVLPKGAVYVSTDYRNPDPYQDMSMSYRKEFSLLGLGFKRILQYSTHDFSGSDNAPLVIRYNYSSFNLWLTYFLQVIGIGLIFAIYLGIRWSTKAVKDVSGAEVEKEFIPVDEIEEFVKQYEEILSLRERIRETRAKIAAKKMKAKEGKDLRAKLEKRLRSEEEVLKKTKENLVKHGGRYKDSVQKIEIAERKLYEERRNLRTLQQEYRVKKSMTKESYVKLFRERQQTIEKLKNEIDGILVTLRMLLEP